MKPRKLTKEEKARMGIATHFKASKKVAKKCAGAREMLADGNPIVITNVLGEDIKVTSVDDLVALTLNMRDALNKQKDWATREAPESKKPRTIKAQITFERIHESGIAVMNRKRAERNGGPIEYGG